jgi:YD repeat-containing protein
MSMTRPAVPPSDTQLAGTDAVKTTYAYAYPFDLLTQVTDPLGNVTSYGRNALGDVTSITDPLTSRAANEG